MKTYTRVEWDTLNSQEQRQAFAASGVIHVRGEPPFDILPDVKDLKSFEGLSRLVDLDRPLFCHGKLTNKNVCRITENVTLPSDRPVDC